MAPVFRILLRYLAGLLLAKGWISQGDQSLFTDPELISSLCYAAAALCGVISECWWYLARKRGWTR